MRETDAFVFIDKHSVIFEVIGSLLYNTLRPRQNDWNCPDDIFNGLKWKKTSLLTFCDGNLQVAGGFTSQSSSNMESVLVIT